MNDQASLDRCLSFVNCHIQAPRAAGTGYVPQPRAVTISRQVGCGAALVAAKLASLLQAAGPVDVPPWTVFDRNLMEKVLEDHNLPKRLAEFLPEDRMTELQDISEELFGLRPGSWTVVQQTSETILHLAELGSVILIGRGATVLTSRFTDVLHVRLVAPLEQRVARTRRVRGLTENAARAACIREDLGRRRYLKKYFKADVDDPLLYHMVINTGMLSFDEAARLIADAALKRQAIAPRSTHQFADELGFAMARGNATATASAGL